MITRTRVTLTLLIILFSALLWAAAAAPITSAKSTMPVGMKRELAPIHYLTALDLSLAYGPDVVNWKKVIWS